MPVHGLLGLVFTQVRRMQRAVRLPIPAVYFVLVAAEFAAMTHLALQATAHGHAALAVGGLSSVLRTGILLAMARVCLGAAALSVLAVATLPWHRQYAG